MKLIPPNITPGPWGHQYTSAAQARNDYPGTDGGGASGSIYDKAGQRNVYDRKTIAHLPHHRAVAEDTEREANARAIAAAPETLAALAACLALIAELNEGGANNPEEQQARAALLKAGYKIEE